MYKTFDMRNGWKFELGWGGTCFTLGFGWLASQRMFHVNLIFVTLSVFNTRIKGRHKDLTQGPPLPKKPSKIRREQRNGKT